MAVQMNDLDFRKLLGLFVTWLQLVTSAILNIVFNMELLKDYSDY